MSNKSITIMANSSRDQEGYTDTQMGVSLDIECDLSDVGSFIIKLRKLEKVIKSLYPPYESSEIEPDVQYREGTACHMFYRFDFSRIGHPEPSILHSLSSLMSAFTAFKVSELFKSDGYKILNDSRDEVTSVEVSKEVCDDQFICFLWYVSDSLCEIDYLEFEDNQEEFLKQFEDPSFLELAMTTLGDECDREFGFMNPMDRTIPFRDYNPLTSSEKSLAAITERCVSINHTEILEFVKNNIINGA